VSWRDRILQMALAGGAFSLSACNGAPSNPPGIPCGNANPDPCICGRPQSDPAAKAACDAKRACEADGGVWIGFGADCEFGGGTSDAAPMSDASSDGD
jgi:hypothetical protein